MAGNNSRTMGGRCREYRSVYRGVGLSIPENRRYLPDSRSLSREIQSLIPRNTTRYPEKSRPRGIAGTPKASSTATEVPHATILDATGTGFSLGRPRSPHAPQSSRRAFGSRGNNPATASAWPPTAPSAGLSAKTGFLASRRRSLTRCSSSGVAKRTVGPTLTHTRPR